MEALVRLPKHDLSMPLGRFRYWRKKVEICFPVPIYWMVESCFRWRWASLRRTNIYRMKSLLKTCKLLGKGAIIRILQSWDFSSIDLITCQIRLDRPMTLSEKILYSHIDEPASQVRYSLFFETEMTFNRPIVFLGNQSWRELLVVAPGSRCYAGCNSTDGDAAVHLEWSSSSCCPLHNPLRPLDWGPHRRSKRLG